MERMKVQRLDAWGLRVVTGGNRRELAAPAPAKPKLLDRMREAMRSRHYSRSTERSYCNWVKRLIYFCSLRHPTDMDAPTINPVEAAEAEWCDRGLWRVPC